MPDTAVADISFLSLEEGLAAAQDVRMRGDLTGALRIYSALRSAWPDSPLPYQRAASAMVDSANHDEADLLLEAAMQRFPSHVGVAADHAWVSHRRHDTAEAMRRWGRLRSRFADHPIGFTGAASTLRDVARMDEAEALLSEARSRFPNDPAPMAELAWFAAAKRDWPLAIERWETLRHRFPRLWTGYSGGIAALRGGQRLDEAEALAHEAVERFPNEPIVLIEYANVATARRDWPEALLRWERAERKAVGRLEVHSGRALALREQQRFDAAEAELAEAMRRFPAAPSLVADYAWIAHVRHDWPEAIVRWAELRRRFPQQSIGFTSGAIALREANRPDEAEGLLTHAVQRFPDLLQPFQELARLAQIRGDWPEAERRWAQIQQRAPNDPTSFHGAAICLREQGRLEQAEALLADAGVRFPQHAMIQIDLGWLLNRRRDFTGACVVWERVRQAFPDQLMGYTGGAVALRDLHRHDDAATLLRDALKRFPGRAEPLIELAWVAQFRGDQAAARTMFQQVINRFPPQPVPIFGLAQVAMALGQYDEAEARLRAGLAEFPSFRLFTEALETLPNRRREAAARQAEGAPKEAEKARTDQGEADQGEAGLPDTPALPVIARPDPVQLDVAARDLMMRFESLGGFRFGAELGCVQRACGAEPQTLLRWADLPFEGLMAALDQRFAGFGTADNAELFVAPRADGGREYCLRDKRFSASYRCFVDEADIAADQMRDMVRRQAGFLAQKLVASLQSGGQIFVYRLSDRGLVPAELGRLRAAVNAYGNVSLLFVGPADEAHSAGSVVLAEPGLAIGYMDVSGATRPGEPAALAIEAWTTLLRNAEAALTECGSDAKAAAADAPALAFGATPSGVADADVAGATEALVPDAVEPTQPVPAIGGLSVIKVLFAGFHMSAQIGQLLHRAPLFRDRLSIHRVDPAASIDSIRGRLPARWLETADIHFEESMVGDANTRRALRNALPGRCDVRSYPTPSMRFLWPFLGADDRLVPEPPIHNGGRYPNSDRIGAGLVGLTGMTDDALFDAYMLRTMSETLDLDASLSADLARWDAEDSRHDVKVTPTIRALFRDQRVFVAPHERAAPVIRTIAMQLLETPTLQNTFNLNAMRAAVNHITRNWSVSRQELPVHPRVAAHFGLTWWSPDMRYRIHGNRFTFREYIIRYIRWSPWMS